MKICRSLLSIAFLFSLLSSEASASPFVSRAPNCRVRVGLMTDTHISDEPSSCELVEKALKLFASEKADAVFHIGDFGAIHSPLGYVHYRTLMEEIFGEHLPLALYAFGGHDRNRYKLKPGDKSDVDGAWAVMQKGLKTSQGLYHYTVFKGYPFVVLNQFVDEQRSRALIEKAIADCPGKPVFVLMHEPAFATVDCSLGWGNKIMRRMCADYPQIIHLSGHTHGSNRNERQIWQGEFTEVNVGCLQNWVGRAGNSMTGIQYKRDDGVLIMDICDHAVVFHRYSLRTGKEYRPEKPWTVPLPFDPATAPYATARRRAVSRPPVWQPGTVATSAVYSEGNYHGIRVTVPEATHEDGVYVYAAELCDKAGKRISIVQALGEFYVTPESARTGKVSFAFDEALFDSDDDYIVKIRPEDFFGNVGAALETTVRGLKPDGSWKTFWRAEDPMKELAFMEEASRPMKVGADGWVETHRWLDINLPKAATLPGGKGSQKCRIVVTLEDEHEMDGSWELRVSDRADRRSLFQAVLTINGKPGPVAYVLPFETGTDKPVLPYFYLWYGSPGARLRVKDIHLDVKFK